LAVAAGARVRVILHERPIVRIIGPFVRADSARVLVHDDRAGILVGADWKDIESIEVYRLITIGGTVVGGTLGLLFQDSWRTVWELVRPLLHSEPEPKCEQPKVVAIGVVRHDRRAKGHDRRDVPPGRKRELDSRLPRHRPPLPIGLHVRGTSGSAEHRAAILPAERGAEHLERWKILRAADR
jgi:hypothetical protein